jgi:hypothetical protein
LNWIDTGEYDMFRARRIRRGVVVAALSGGMLFADGCFTFLTSVPVCGVVVPTTVCTPRDQLLLTLQFQEFPNYSIDPTCTIPFGCSDDGPLSTGGTGEFPYGGEESDEPEENQGGGAGGLGGIGGGGGGGGI